MLEEILYPFVFSLGGELWHDTIKVYLPPSFEDWLVYSPVKYRSAVLYFIYFGDVRILNPDTLEPEEDILSDDVGFEHEHMYYMILHNDPMLKSILGHRPYIMLAYVDETTPHRLLLYNRIDDYVFIDATIWVAEFPMKELEIEGETVSIEKALIRYLSGIFYFYYKHGKEAQRKYLPIIRPLR